MSWGECRDWESHIATIGLGVVTAVSDLDINTAVGQITDITEGLDAVALKIRELIYSVASWENRGDSIAGHSSLADSVEMPSQKSFSMSVHMLYSFL